VGEIQRADLFFFGSPEADPVVFGRIAGSAADDFVKLNSGCLAYSTRTEFLLVRISCLTTEAASR